MPIAITRSASQRLLVNTVTINKASVMSTQLALNPTQFIYGELVFYAGAQNFGFRSAENL